MMRGSRIRHFHAAQGKTREQGVALVVVLLMVAILSVVVGEFLYEVRINSILASNYQARLRAHYVAKAGINAAEGMLKHSDPLGGNQHEYELAGVINIACLPSPIMPLVGLGQEPEQEQDDPQSDQEYRSFSERQGCGQLSMTLSYPIGDDLLQLQVSDEQTKLNLNALVTRTNAQEKQQGKQAPKPQATTEETGAGMNPDMFFQVLELMKMARDRKQLELTDTELEYMLFLLVDWLDFGEYQGELDRDDLRYFDYEDTIYPMKNGPLDTVGELRLIPGMTDDLFSGMEPYVTVYPMGNSWFAPEINIHGASQEVLYALIRGATYSNEEPTLTPEETWAAVEVLISDSYDDANGMTKQRTLPMHIKDKVQPFITDGKPAAGGRYYNIYSTGTTPQDITSSIVAVLHRDNLGKFRPIYWREQ